MPDLDSLSPDQSLALRTAARNLGEDWELDDPAGQTLDAVRPIRDEIGQRVRALLASLDIGVSA